MTPTPKLNLKLSDFLTAGRQRYYSRDGRFELRRNSDDTTWQLLEAQTITILGEGSTRQAALTAADAPKLQGSIGFVPTVDPELSEAVTQYRPIDSVPRDLTYVLVISTAWAEPTNAFLPKIAAWDRDLGWISDTGHALSDDFTHWAPLPATSALTKTNNQNTENPHG